MGKSEWPHKLFRNDEILKALRMMNKGKAAGSTEVVIEMFLADDCLSVD